MQLEAAGANGLALFNRFYQPDIDIEELDVVPNLRLSTADELRLRLRWLAVLSGQLDVSLGCTGGAHNAVDVRQRVTLIDTSPSPGSTAQRSSKRSKRASFIGCG